MALAAVVVVLRLALNVTVRAPAEPITAEHGFAVPAQVVEETPLTFDHPANVDPAAGAAARVMTAPLSDVVMFGEHALVTV